MIANSTNCSNKAKTEEVQNSMLDLYGRGDDHLAPDEVIFNTLMDTYSKSDQSDAAAADRSLSILETMKNTRLNPM